MNRILFLYTFLTAGVLYNGNAQDTGSRPDSVAGIGPAQEYATEELAPTGISHLIEDIGVRVPPSQQTPEFDREHLEALRRRLFDDMPRYPTLKLWDGQNAYPFLYSSRNRYMGLDMAGIGTSVRITDWLSTDIRAYVSGAYMGREYPGRYMNASLSGTVRIKLHERVYLVGMGEISAREGLHPKIAPGFGGKNSLGAGVEIWITEKFGVTFSRTWEYYQGSWYGHYGYGPIGR